MGTILQVRQGGAEFFVLAEKNFVPSGKEFLDFATKHPFDAKELSYSLTKLKDGKPKTFLGYVSDISPKSWQLIRLPVKVTEYMSTTSYTKEFRFEGLHIIQKVYDLD